SFPGLGNPDDTQPEWGQMLGRAQQYFNTHPEVAVYPAVCIIIVALGFTLMGESLREALDPKDRKSTRLNSSHVKISYAVFCLKKKKATGSPRRLSGGWRTD